MAMCPPTLDKLVGTQQNPSCQLVANWVREHCNLVN